MGYGYGGRRGFGFRGYSPPFPYIGRGRGGLPRCLYPGLWGAWTPPYYGRGRSPPFYTAYPTGVPSHDSKIAQEQELRFLKEWEKAVKENLDAINARIKELETREE